MANILPGELAARIESAMWDAPHSDDPEKSVSELKDFLLDNAPSIVFYLRALKNGTFSDG